MFSSLSEFNQKLANFTQTLSLDNLQNDKTIDEVSDKEKDLSDILSKPWNNDEEKKIEKNNRDESTPLQLELLKQNLSANEKLIRDLQLHVQDKNDELLLEKENKKMMTARVKELEGLERSLKKQLQDHKNKANREIQDLEERLEEYKRNYDEQTQSNAFPSTVEATIDEPVKIQDQTLINTQSDDKYEKMEMLLNKAKERIESLKKKLETAKEQSRDYQDKLNESEKMREQIEVESADIRHDLNQTILERENEIKSMKDKLQKLETNLKTEEAVRMENMTLLASQNQKVQQLSGELSELRNQYIASQNDLKHINQEKDSSNKLIQLKDRSISELQYQLKESTEKLQTVTQQLNELNTKHLEAGKHFELKINELSKNNQSKDSEGVFHKQKIENLEKNLSDQRLMASELAERYGETQREMARNQNTINELQLLTERLQQELKLNKSDYLVLETARNEMRQRLEESQNKLLSQESLQKLEITNLNMKHDKIEQENLSTINNLKLQLNELSSKLRNDQDSTNNLDNYKRRAQLALTKANNTVVSLRQENGELKMALDESKSQLIVSERNSQSMESKIMEMNIELDDLRNKLQSERKRIEDLTAERNHIKEMFDEVNCRLNDETKRQQQLKITDDVQRNDFSPVVVYSGNDLYDQITSNHPDTLKTVQGIRDETDDSMSENKITSNQFSKSWAIIAAEEAIPNRADQLDINSSISDVNKYSFIQDNSHYEVVQHDTAELGSNLLEQHLNTAVADKDKFHQTKSKQLNLQPNKNRFDLTDRDENHRSYLLVSELNGQLEALKKDLSQRGIELEAAHQELQHEREEKKKLINRIEELMAFLERAKKLHEGPDSAINMEYLKHCVFKYMSSTDLSEKKRLYPVLATILKLTSQEKRLIEEALSQLEDTSKDTITSISSSIENLFGSASSVFLAMNSSSTS